MVSTPLSEPERGAGLSVVASIGKAGVIVLALLLVFLGLRFFGAIGVVTALLISMFLLRFAKIHESDAPSLLKARPFVSTTKRGRIVTYVIGVIALAGLIAFALVYASLD